VNPPRFPPILPKPPAQFSLILAGGLARGAAHLGVWRALTEAQLVPERVVGVSIGAIIGGWLCKEGGTGQALDYLRKLARTVQRNLSATGRNVLDAWRLLSLRERRAFIEERLGLKHLTFRELPLPLYVAATRLLPPGRVIFGDHPGDSVAEAILASSAVPSHPPVRVGNTYYLDGGLSGNLPVREAVKRGGRVILAVNLGPPLRRGTGRMGEVAWRLCQGLYHFSSLREIESSRAEGAIVLQVRSPEIEAHGLFAFEKLDMFEEQGYKATQCVLPALQRVLRHLGGEAPSTSAPRGGTDGS
jgi:NTE family protein